MTPPDDEGRGRADAMLDYLEAEADRLFREAREAELLLSDARTAYAPESALEPGAAGPAKAPAGEFQPDRLVTYPLWYAWVLVVHLMLTPVLIGVVAIATALLVAVCWYAVDRWVGVPLLSLGGLCVGALAGVGTVCTMVRSFSDMLKRFPW